MSADYEAARQHKIEEIRRTGKTWQWPDPIPHRVRATGGRKAALIALVWLIAAGWCALISVYPKLASATENELYGLSCIGVGWLTATILRRRR